MVYICPKCNGSGKLGSAPCPKCNGDGIIDLSPGINYTPFKIIFSLPYRVI